MAFEESKEIINRIIPKPTKLKKCSCGQEYYGNYSVCPACYDSKQTQSDKQYKEKALKNKIKDYFKSTITDRLKK